MNVYAALLQRTAPIRIRRPFRTSVLFAVVYAAVVYLDARTMGNINNGDSNNLANGARAAIDCLRNGTASNCGAQPGGHSSIFPYPLLQYLPAGLLVLLGATEQTVVTMLAQLNFLAIVAMPSIAWLGFSRRSRPTALFTAAIIASSLTYHSTSAFGEPLAALVVLGFSVAITQRRVTGIITFGFLASVSKETLFPVLLLVLAASVLLSGRKCRADVTTRRLVIAGIAAITSGIALNAIFNIFRFGTWRNTMYLTDEFRTDGALRSASYLIGQFISPSSGVLAFWPVWTVVIVIGIAALAKPGQRMSDRVAALCIFASIGALASSLALWYSPFGGITLGPRLMVPLLPATAYLMITYIDRLRLTKVCPLLQTCTWGRRAAAAIIAPVAIPTALVTTAPWTWSRGIAALTAPSETCAGLLNVPIQEDRGGYFACTDDIMFRIRPSVLRQLWDPSLDISGTAWILGTTATLVFLLFGFGLIGTTETPSIRTNPPSQPSNDTDADHTSTVQELHS